MTFKRYKVRLFPTKDQEKMFWKHIHACRFIWNWMVEINKINYIDGGFILSHYDMCNLLQSIKKEHPWLHNVSLHTLNITCADLAKRLEMIYTKDITFPKFKSKKFSKNIFPIRNDRTYFQETNIVKIPKCGKVKC